MAEPSILKIVAQMSNSQVTQKKKSRGPKSSISRNIEDLIQEYTGRRSVSSSLSSETREELYSNDKKLLQGSPGDESSSKSISSGQSSQRNPNPIRIYESSKMKKPGSISNDSGSRRPDTSRPGRQAPNKKELVYQNTIVRLRESNGPDSRKSARSDSLGSPSVDFD